MIWIYAGCISQISKLENSVLVDRGVAFAVYLTWNLVLAEEKSGPGCSLFHLSWLTSLLLLNGWACWFSRGGSAICIALVRSDIYFYTLKKITITKIKSDFYRYITVLFILVEFICKKKRKNCRHSTILSSVMLHLKHSANY